MPTACAPHRSRLSWLSGILLATLVMPACAGGWKGSGDIYRKADSDEATFRFGLPGSDWEPVREKGSQVAWAHRNLPALIQLQAQCERHGDSSLEQFTDHLHIDFREWKVVSQKPEQFAGRDALRTTVDASLDGGYTMKFELLVLKKNGCLFDLHLMAAPSAFDQARPAFEQVAAGFQFPVE